MLWSPNEVLAYLKDDLGIQSKEKTKNVFSKTSAFGGFSQWPSPEEDFVFIAENSEIHGPNALFTIPSQPKEIDLNALATRMLSADYQGISSNKSTSLSHAQLLMPDISKDIHAAINYFLLFDADARGFIRPTCIAYITSNKYKLICLAEQILTFLSEASTILQHSNMLHCLGDLKAVLQDINSPLDEGKIAEVPLKRKITEDVSKEIQDIISVIESYKGDERFDKQLSTIVEIVKKKAVSVEISKLLTIPRLCLMQPVQWKNKNHHNNQKHMKNLFFTCGNGLVLGLYHLFLMHKHFRRKFENIHLSQNSMFRKQREETLYYGACVKASDMMNSSLSEKDCILISNRFEKAPSMDSEQYFLFVDDTFQKMLLDFLHWEANFLQESDQGSSSLLQSGNFSDTSTEPESVCSSSSGYLSSEPEISDCDTNKKCGHIVTLENIWDVIEDLQHNNPGVESAFLEIIKLFDDSQKLLFSILTRTPIVIISTPEEISIAQNFVRAISVFVPRGKDEVIFVDLDRQEPLETEHLKYTAAVNVCISYPKTTEEIIPQHLWQSLCILNLRDCSLTAPAYAGVLLSKIDERFRMLSLDGPAFPVVVGILCEVQSALQWWLMVTLPSVDAKAASSSILERGFSRLDVQILLKLSKLCRS